MGIISAIAAFGDSSSTLWTKNVERIQSAVR